MSKEKKTRQAARRAEALLKELELGKPSPTDPQGSYTGCPEWDKRPVQDADDL